MSPTSCKHNDVVLNVSDFAPRAGFKRASKAQLAAAADSKGLGRAGSSGDHNGNDKKYKDESTTYPAPLILPDDILALDPEDEEPQSVHEYIHQGGHNRVTPARKTIYVVTPPQIDKSVAFVKDWQKPVASRTSGPSGVSSDGMHKQVMEYMSTFYHGMPVKLYDGPPMNFTRHQGSDKRSKTNTRTPKFIDLSFGDNLVLDIRTRACPDRRFPRQLNLDDLINVLINMLPKNGYAIIMLVDQDIWEDDEEIFTAGRAYGGSRVCVVSTARYNPRLDADIGLDTEHAWPASHCKTYVDQCIAEYDGEAVSAPPAKKRAKTGPKGRARVTGAANGASASHPIRNAIDAYQLTWSGSFDASRVPDLNRLWLSRVCRTASHELGHCVGIGHCSYYACLMQSTAGLLEDSRQPLYLCPVDEAKVLNTTKVTAVERDRAMMRLLHEPGWMAEPTFAALEAWLRCKSGITGEGDSSGQPIVLE